MDAKRQQLDPLGLEESSAVFTPETIIDAAGKLRGYTLFSAIFPAPEDAPRIAQYASNLRAKHRLKGKVADPRRLHVTLHAIAHFSDTLPQAEVDAAKAAAASVSCPTIPLVFDRALTFVASNAFVLRCDDDGDAAIARLRAALGLALQRVGLAPKPSQTAHLTVLYDDRHIDEHAVEPLRWTATRFALVLSHVGLHHHEWLGEWPLSVPARG